jgi:23S rRNA-/tRNA-specific pseudouridylate synthase
VKGAPRGGASEGRVEAPIDGKEAATRWTLVGRAGTKKRVVAVLTAHPLTGRKHQLRIHLASIGCPILGDKQHGAPTIPMAQQLGLRRVALHAESLALRHPVTGAALAFEAPWPRELEEAWQFARRVLAQA